MNREQNTLDLTGFLRIRRQLIMFNFKTIFGFIFSFFGILFSFYLVKSFNPDSLVLDWRDSFETEGIINNVSKTGFAEDEIKIFEFVYDYNADSHLYTGVDYGTGKLYDIGEKVVVNVMSSNHEISKVSGLRKSPFDLFALVTLLIPIAGLFILIRGVTWGINKAKIIKDGLFVIGKSIKSIETDMSENDDTLFKHIITYTDLKDNVHITKYFSIDRKINSKVNLVYSRSNPDKAYIFDSTYIIGKRKIINYCRQQCV